MKVFPFASLLAVLSCAASMAGAQQPRAPSVALASNDVIWLDRNGIAESEPVPVDIENLMRSEVLSVTLRVRIDGRDVTGLLSPAHEIAFDFLGRTRRSGWRLDLFTLGLSAVSLSPGQRIEYRASVTGAGFELFDTATATVRAPEAPDSCVQDCVCAFLRALGAEKDPDSGTVRFASGLSCADIRTAETNLRDCLAECVPPVSSIDEGKFTCTDAEGHSLRVKIDLAEDGGGDDAVASSSLADVVIAIGGDADPGSNSDGGGATATSTKSGGASLAIGGNGGGNANSPGDGGTGTARSTKSDGGDAYGVGGHGGNGDDSGGDGGEGKGTTKNPNSTGFGQGGNGGDPTQDPPNPATGGKGGNGTGSRGSDSSAVTGIGAGQPDGNPISDGEHGEGGWGRSELPQWSGQNGTALPNT